MDAPPSRGAVTRYRPAMLLTGAAVASALVMGLAQSYQSCAWLLCGGLVPLCLVLDGRGFRSAWLPLLLFNGFYTLFTAHWIRLTGTGFVWFLLISMLYQMAWTALPAAGLWWAGRHREDSAFLLYLPAAWMAMELVSRRLLFGVSWALLGLPLADYPVLAQAASVGAPEALSFLVAAIGVAVALGIREPAGRAFRAALVQGPGLAAVLLIFGFVRISGSLAAPTEKIAIVQPVLSQQVHWERRENRTPELARLNTLIDRAAATSPDMIVLPEGILPGLVRYESDLADFATGAVRRSRVPVLFGTLDRDFRSEIFNVAYRIGIDGEVDQYRKRRLVPFVEQTPWPFTYRPADGWVQFSPGQEATLMPEGNGKRFAVLMCLEDTYPDLAREYALGGADFLIAMVNTENFRGTNQGLAHLRRSRLTAVAAGLPLLRAGNSGISCSIDARGRILGQLQPDREAAVQLPVSTARIPTVYRRAGDVGVLFMLLVVVLAVWLYLTPKVAPMIMWDAVPRSIAETAAR
jgi:apolipoprotein N-acyltransferase